MHFSLYVQTIWGGGAGRKRRGTVLVAMSEQARSWGGASNRGVPSWKDSYTEEIFLRRFTVTSSSRMSPRCDALEAASARMRKGHNPFVTFGVNLKLRDSAIAAFCQTQQQVSPMNQTWRKSRNTRLSCRSGAQFAFCSDRRSGPDHGQAHPIFARTRGPGSRGGKD